MARLGCCASTNISASTRNKAAKLPESFFNSSGYFCRVLSISSSASPLRCVRDSKVLNPRIAETLYPSLLIASRYRRSASTSLLLAAFILPSKARAFGSPGWSTSAFWTADSASWSWLVSRSLFAVFMYFQKLAVSSKLFHLVLSPSLDSLSACEKNISASSGFPSLNLILPKPPNTSSSCGLRLKISDKAASACSSLPSSSASSAAERAIISGSIAARTGGSAITGWSSGFAEDSSTTICLCSAVCLAACFASDLGYFLVTLLFVATMIVVFSGGLALVSWATTGLTKAADFSVITGILLNEAWLPFECINTSFNSRVLALAGAVCCKVFK